MDAKNLTRRATLDDVAAVAGVSPKTVSRVVNGDSAVSEKTRAKVGEAIAETGFQINQAARALAGARSFLIGLFTINGSSYFFSELYRAAARECKASAHHLVLEEYAAGESSYISLYEKGLKSIRCDGVILPPPVCDDLALLDALDRDGVRYVRLAPKLEPERSTAIYADDHVGAADLARHLWAQGWRRFTVVVGPVDHASAAVRRDAFVDTLLGLGCARSEIRLIAYERSNKAYSTMAQLVEAVFDGLREQEAVFAFNDELATRVMLRARARGLDLPRDLAIAGFDDSDAAKVTWPTLTTVRQPVAELARLAVAELTAYPAKPPRIIRCPVKLIVRDSTKLS
ncbi:LacI family DNA-binding transcriptional regulator [uncultured Erythrobacter sp.]|uniref:LacI family DNA-binding transcriptional regulator n=1 Tax=uncultured Erythrobacter sp. TaxID=263913 RepID=UPI00265ACCEB|nr:LacI family DNA-binding transcriptional regulator [uncultured Erythrobacter sp.]